MTERLYYHDAYLRNFTAAITDRSTDGLTIYLDRTAFYPTSGGQPYDLGSIAGVPLVEVVDEVVEGVERVAHHVASPVGAATAECAVDWTRRFDHMQQHTGQHLISAVFEEFFGLRTVSFHLGADSATIDLEGAPVEPRTLLEVERRANEIIYENRPVHVTFEDAAAVQGLRKPSDRAGTLRIISIDSLDRSACGGTHVRSTGEIGAVLLRKTEKIRQAVRVEFVCGGRAVRRARADYESLAKTAQLFSAQFDEIPAMVAAQLDAAKSTEKAARKLSLDLAAYQGKELYASTTPGDDGIRRASRRLDRGNLEDLRAIAQTFTEGSKAVFLATLADPPSVLFAASADAGIDAGKILKAAITEAGGRGGGNARIAQGSVANASLLDQVAAKL